jgi:pheromone shutdown protein TraB
LDSESSDDYSPEQKEQWYRQREQHMAEQIEKARSKKDSVLVVCGALHMVQLETYFLNKGEKVITHDLTQASWFSGPLSTEWLSEDG